MQENILELSKNAADVLLSLNKDSRIRVVSHYDADGITSAGIICNAIYRAGYDFHASLMRNPFNKGFERLLKEDNKLIIFSDMGSGQLDEIESLNCKAIVIDHHQYVRKEKTKDIVQINANSCGIDGNYEASGATLSYFFAKAISQKNEDLAPLAIAGATGDKQYIGKMKGLNAQIINEALKNKFLNQKTSIKLFGETVYEALFFSIDPYFSGISGNDSKIREILSNLDIEKDTKIEDVDNQSLVKLQSYLLFLLIKKGVQKNILDTVIRKRYYSEMTGCELEIFADILDACGKYWNRGLGLCICLGNKEAFQEGKKILISYKQKVLDSLLKLEKDGAVEKNSMRYFYADDSSLGGVIAGIAVNYLFDDKKPLISIARKQKENEIHISCRGNQELVKNGLDLGFVMKKISSELKGYGGGHKIASGATLSLDKEEEFIKKSDELIEKQMVS